jgi:ribonuclease HI
MYKSICQEVLFRAAHYLVKCLQFSSPYTKNSVRLQTDSKLVISALSSKVDNWMKQVKVSEHGS